MFIEEVQICSANEPFVSIVCDLNVDALVACTYSKDTVNRSGRILILDKLTLNELHSVRLPSAAFHLEFNPRAKLYMTGLGDGQIALFNAQTRQLSIDKPKPFAVQMVTDVKMDESCSRVAFTDEVSSLRVYGRENSTIVFERSNAHSLYGQSVNAWCCEFIDDNLLASGGDDNLLKFWDIRENDERPVRTNKCHDGGVVRLRTIGDEKLCTGSYDEKLRIFDLRSTDKPINCIELGGGVWDFEFDMKTGKIYVACMYNGLSIIELTKMEILYNHKMPDQLIYGITRAAESSIYCCSFTSGKAWCFKTNL